MNAAKYLSNKEQKKCIDSITPVVPQRFYTMEYTADYKLDEFIKSGATSLETFSKYAATTLLDPVKLGAGIALGKILKTFGAGCSVFTGRNHEKQPLFFRGYDFPHRPSVLLLHTHPKNGYRSLGMCDLGFMNLDAGALEDGKADLSTLMLAPYITVDGMNEKGFCIAALALIHEGVNQNTGKQKISTTVAIRMLLDRAATVNEAIELLKKYDMCTNLPESDFQFAMMDKTGMSKVVYYMNGELRETDARYVTNYYLNPFFGEEYQEPRYNMMRSYVISTRDTFEEDDGLAMLRCLSCDGNNASKSFTVWDAVMNPETGSFDVIYDRDWKNLYKYTV